MGRKNHNPVFSQTVDQAAEPHPLLRVKPCRGLIQDQQLRIVQHGLGDPHPLNHTTGKLPHFFIPHPGQRHQFQQFVDLFFRIFFFHTLQRRNIP